MACLKNLPGRIAVRFLNQSEHIFNGDDVRHEIAWVLHRMHWAQTSLRAIHKRVADRLPRLREFDERQLRSFRFDQYQAEFGVEVLRCLLAHPELEADEKYNKENNK